MSWILGIDTSSAELSVGLVLDGKPFLSYSRYVRNSHAEHIARTMNVVLESSGIKAADITCAGIAVGPGSFTGLRIGISFIKGFFLTHDTPILPVSSLQSMAESFNGSDGSIASLMDARQNRVYYAKFKRENGMLKRLTDDTIIPAESILTMCTSDDTVIFDTLGYKKNPVLDFLKGKLYFHTPDEVTLQRGLACALIAAGSVNNSSLWKKSTDILPNYMQPSYAEMKHNNAKKQNQMSQT